MIVYECGRCGLKFKKPDRKRWKEKIDGIHWCDMSEQICPSCGDPDIIAMEEDDDDETVRD